MRQKFPHLVDFAWASSAPLRYEPNFTSYIAAADAALDTQVGGCDELARNLRQTFQTNVSTNYTAVHEALNLSQSTDLGSVYFIFNSQIADTIQFATYGNLTNMCNAFKDKSGTAFYSWFRSVNKNPDSLDPLLYNSPQFADQRSWFWTSCIEAGWFPVVKTEPTFGSPNVNWSYFQRVCTTLFGTPMVNEDVTTRLTVRFGGQAPAVTNVFFVYGDDDPWRYVVFKEAVNWTNQNVAVIPRGSHCSELIGPQPGEPPNVTHARETLTNQFMEWASRDCLGRCSNHGHCVLSICVCDKDFEGEWCTDRTVSDWTFKSFSAILLFVPMVMIIIIGVTAWLLFYHATQEPSVKVH
jgi:hypothetical protein